MDVDVDREGERAVVAHLQVLRSSLLQPVTSVEALLDLLVPPLDLLGLVSNDRLRRRHGWTASAAGLPASRQEKTAAFRRSVKGFQTALVDHVIVHWAGELDRIGLWEDVLGAWFAPVCAGAASSTSVEQVDGSASAIALQGLHTLLFTLSSIAAPSGGSAPHPTLLSNVFHLLTLLVERHSVTSLHNATFTSALRHPMPSKRQLAWEDSVKALVSVPAKVANAASLARDKVVSVDVPTELGWREWNAVLTRQMDDFVWRMGENGSAMAVLPLLSKLIRTGFVTDPSASLSASDSFFPSLFLNILSHRSTDNPPLLSLTIPQSYRSAWTRLVDAIVLSEKTIFLRGLLSFLQRSPLLADVTPSASGRLGKGNASEVEAYFASWDAEARSRGAAALLSFFVRAPLPTASSDDEDELQSEEALVDQVVLGGAGMSKEWNSGIARAVMKWVEGRPVADSDTGKTADCQKAIANMLFRILPHWADTTSVRMASFSHRLFLTTLLIAAISMLSTNHPALVRLSMHPDFLNGTHAHLSHMSPSVRLLGMLTAELVSEQTVSAIASSSKSPSKTIGKKPAMATQDDDKDLDVLTGSASAGGEPPKALKFSASFWEGDAPGRAEARALRRWSERLSCEGWEEEKDPQGGWREVWRLVDTALGFDSASSSEGAKPMKGQEIQTQKPSEVVEPPVNEGDEGGIRAGRHEDRVLKKAQPPQRSKKKTTPLIQSLDSASGSETEDGLEGYDLPPSESSASESEDELPDHDQPYDSSMIDPKKKKIRPPIYVSELGVLLRSGDVEKIETALKHADALVRRKKGWGGEVDENAVDLCFALFSLQNNFDLEQFEERRTAALTAVIVCSPERAAGCVIEQYFHHQYSIAQRVAMLTALALAARELAGFTPSRPESGSPAPPSRVFPSKLLPPHLHRKYASPGDVAHLQGDGELSKQTGQLEVVMEGLRLAAIDQVRQGGEEKSSELQRERKLTVRRFSKRPEVVAKQEAALAKATSSQLGGSGVRPLSYNEVAAEVFILPLVERFSEHLRHLSTRGLRTTPGSQASKYAGTGTGTLYDPLLLGKFFTSLGVMVHAARHSPAFQSIIVERILELVVMVNDILGIGRLLGVGAPSAQTITLLRQGPGEESPDDSSYVLLTALLSLSLVVLDACAELDQGRIATRDHGFILSRIADWARSVFERFEGAANRAAPIATAASTGGDPAGEVERAAAAVCIRVSEMVDKWVRGGLGWGI